MPKLAVGQIWLWDNYATYAIIDVIDTYIIMKNIKADVIIKYESVHMHETSRWKLIHDVVTEDMYEKLFTLLQCKAE